MTPWMDDMQRPDVLDHVTYAILGALVGLVILTVGADLAERQRAAPPPAKQQTTATTEKRPAVAWAVYVPSTYTDTPRAPEPVLDDPEPPLARTTPPPAQPAPSQPVGDVWDSLAACESNGDWNYGPHSGWGSGLYQGGLQWKHSTWLTWKAPGDPHNAWDATRAQEVAAAERLRAAEVAAGRGGFGPWPGCARALGLPR